MDQSGILDRFRTIVAPEETSLHPRVAPQPLHDHPQLVRELAILPWSRGHRKELPGVVLQQIETGGKNGLNSISKYRGVCKYKMQNLWQEHFYEKVQDDPVKLTLDDDIMK